jgi:hypothetical protein
VKGGSCVMLLGFLFEDLIRSSTRSFYVYDDLARFRQGSRYEDLVGGSCLKVLSAGVPTNTLGPLAGIICAARFQG